MVLVVFTSATIASCVLASIGATFNPYVVVTANLVLSPSGYVTLIGDGSFNEVSISPRLPSVVVAKWNPDKLVSVATANVV